MNLFKSLKSYKGTAFEVIVIVFGVMLSFLLNEIRLDLDDKDETISTLQQIKTDLQKDLFDTNINLPLEHSSMLAIIKLIECIEAKEPYTESINNTFSYLTEWTFLLPSTTALEIINSNGVNYLTNDSLRIKFLSLHNYTYIERLMLFKSFKDDLDVMKAFYAKNFTQSYEMYKNYEAEPLNYNELLENNYFKGLLFNHLQGHKGLYETDSLIKQTILELLPLVDEEIEKLK
tara:strand:- start:74 stop:769 length:696 start_codon:yes stop_codon:yes gene_type:complete